MRYSFRNIGWKFKAILPLFVFLILFHITPNTHAIIHTVVHDQEIAHTHLNVGEDHSQEDHHSGKVDDFYFHEVFATLQSQARLISVFFSPSALKCLAVSWEIPFQSDPPGLVLNRFEQIFQPSFFTELQASHPLRAPPPSA